MVRWVWLAFGVLVLLGWPSRSQAGDVFTGFQIDNKGEYFSYLGVRAPLLKLSGNTTLFSQLTTAALGYNNKSGNQILDANVQFLVPSVGISQTLGGWTLSALAGPQLRRIEEQRVNASASIDHQIGAYGQVEALYWHEQGTLHAIVSYADLDNFFWSRVRGKLLTYAPEQSCCRVYMGWDAAAMGNADFKAIQTGPLVEIPVGKIFLLAKGGYQNSSSFHSGGYGGIEIYFGF